MKKRDVSIQILRVSACALVFLTHFGQRVGLSGILSAFTSFGAYGTHLFLLISGFLAAKTFFGNPNVDILNYYKKRMVAILPLYYFVILYFFITENILNHFVSVIPPDELGLGWFRYIFLLNGFLNSDTYFWSNLGITWTIPVFMFFYLIAPWIVRKINTVFSSVIVFSVVFVMSYILNKYHGCVIFSKLPLTFLGVVIYACVYKKYSIVACIGFLLLTIFTTILGKANYTYISIFSCIMLLMSSIDSICLPKQLQRIINALDEYSYTVYLMHGLIFCSILDRLKCLGVSRMLIAIIAITGTFAATVLVGKYIEKPIQKVLKKRFLML